MPTSAFRAALAVLAALALSSRAAPAQTSQVIVGAGGAARAEREVPAAARVSVETPGVLVLRQGPPSLRLEGDANLLPHVTARLRDDGVLVVGTGAVEVQPRLPLRIYLTLPQVESLSVAGSGRVEAEGIRVPRFSLAVPGSGNADLAALEAGAVRVSVPGSGSARLAGRAERVHVVVDGSGSVAAGALAADSARVEVDGSGSVVLRADRLLEAGGRGSGSVEYLGSPRVQMLSWPLSPSQVRPAAP
jgi:hypothetical protein